MTGPIRPTADELLEQEDFLRGLVRGLLRDEHEVDDVVQETWLAALTTPPRPQQRLRAWLAVVARNLVRRKRRYESRRLRREAAAASAAVLPATEAIVERLELQQILVDAVLRLEEPYRTAVLLRYFDSLPASEVAERMGVSAGTIHTRLHRALARLRARLDASRGGDRRTWSLALLPLAATRPGAVALTTNGTAAAAGGAALMAMKTQWIAAVVAVALGAIVWWSWPDLEEIEPSEVTAVRTPELDALAAEPLGPVAEEARRRAPSAGGSDEAAIKEDPLSPATGGLVVTARWEQDGAPAGDLEVEVLRRGTRDLVPTVRTDEDGKARWEELEPGEVTVRAIRGGRARTVDVVAGETAHAEITIPLGIEVFGEVVDVAGKPIAGAEVRVSAGQSAYEGAFSVEAITGEEGRFAIGSVQDRYVHAWQEGWQRSYPVKVFGSPGTRRHLRFVLDEPAARIAGRVLDGEGAPVAGALVMVDGMTVTTGAEGEFLAVVWPSESEVPLYVRTPEGQWRFLVEMNPAETTEVECRLDPEETATLVGRLRWDNGEPAVGLTVRVTGPGGLGISVSTDAEGEFELSGLFPIKVKLSLFTLGRVGAHDSVDLTAGEITRWEHSLGPKVDVRAIEGQIVDHADRPLPGWWVRVDAGNTAALWPTDDQGRFRVPGCVDRDYSVSAHAPDGSGQIGPLGARIRGYRLADGFVTLRVPERLLPSAYLVGRLEADDPELVRTVDVVVWHTSTDEGGGGEYYATNRDGVFGVGPLPPGPYTLGIRPRGSMSERRGEYQLEPNETRDVGVIWIEPYASIAGRLQAPGDEELVVREVRAVLQDGSGFDEQFNASIEGSAFELVSLTAGEWELTARVDGYPPVEIGIHELAPGQHLNLGTIPIARAGTLQIIPGEASGRSVSAKFLVLLASEQITSGGIWGSPQSIELWPGAYDLIVHGETIADFQQEVEIRSGETTRVEVPLEPGVGCLLVFTDGSSGTATRGHVTIREMSGERVLIDQPFEVAGDRVPGFGTELPAGGWDIEISTKSGKGIEGATASSGRSVKAFDPTKEYLEVSLLDGSGRPVRSGWVTTGGTYAPTWFVQLTPGSYRVVVKDGDELVERSIRIASGVSEQRRLIEIPVR